MTRISRLATRKKKILLILPCNSAAKFGDYKLGETWKFILKHIAPWREFVDLAAVECINNYGIVGEWENEKTKGLDFYPAWNKFDAERLGRLKEAIKKWLREHSHKYTAILAYINVKAYYLALRQAAEESEVSIQFIKLGHFSPMAFRSGVSRLKLKLQSLIPVIPVSWSDARRNLQTAETILDSIGRKKIWSEREKTQLSKALSSIRKVQQIFPPLAHSLIWHSQKDLLHRYNWSRYKRERTKAKMPRLEYVANQ